MGRDPTQPHIAAHAHSSKHRREIEQSSQCGCFYCLSIFPPSRIEIYLDEGDGTAMCPSCGIDSVNGDASGYPIELAFLRNMRAYWFSTA